MFKEINTRNEHRAYQCLDLIQNYQNDIYDSLKDLQSGQDQNREYISFQA